SFITSSLGCIARPRSRERETGCAQGTQGARASGVVARLGAAADAPQHGGDELGLGVGVGVAVVAVLLGERALVGRVPLGERRLSAQQVAQRQQVAELGMAALDEVEVMGAPLRSGAEEPVAP